MSPIASGGVTALSDTSATIDGVVTSLTSEINVNVQTIDNLRSLTTTPKKVSVSGYYAADDEAFNGVFFEWRPQSTEADNGGTIIKLNSVGVGRYHLNYSSTVLKAEWFGVSESLENNLDRLLAADSVGPVELKKGTYKIDGVASFVNHVNFNFSTLSLQSTDSKVEIKGGGGNLIVDANYLTIRPFDISKSAIDVININVIRCAEIGISCKGDALNPLKWVNAKNLITSEGYSQLQTGSTFGGISIIYVKDSIFTNIHGTDNYQKGVRVDNCTRVRLSKLAFDSLENNDMSELYVVNSTGVEVSGIDVIGTLNPVKFSTGCVDCHIRDFNLDVSSSASTDPTFVALLFQGVRRGSIRNGNITVKDIIGLSIEPHPAPATSNSGNNLIKKVKVTSIGTGTPLKTVLDSGGGVIDGVSIFKRCEFIGGNTTYLAARADNVFERCEFRGGNNYLVNVAKSLNEFFKCIFETDTSSNRAIYSTEADSTIFDGCDISVETPSSTYVIFLAGQNKVKLTNNEIRYAAANFSVYLEGDEVLYNENTSQALPNETTRSISISGQRGLVNGNLHDESLSISGGVTTGVNYQLA